MAVAFRSDNDVTNGTAGTSVTVSKPAGMTETGAQGADVMVAVISATGTPSITPPAGWTLIATIASTTNVTMWAYWKLASSEAASFTWTLGTSQRNTGWIGAYTGVDTTTPIYSSITTTSPSTSVTTGTHVPAGGLYIMTATAVRTASGSATTWTVVDEDDGTVNERADLSTNAGAGTDISSVAADLSWSEFGAWSPLVAVATVSQSQTAIAAEFIALRPYFTPYTGVVNGAGLVVEAAFDVDPDDANAASWTWTDITADVHQPAQVSLRHGRGNRASVADPSEMRFTLLNLTGKYTSPSGTYGLKMVRNLPIRVRLNGFGVQSGALGYHRGTFFLSSLRPRWDVSTNFSVVDIVANGRLRRLQQRTEQVHSPAYTAIQRMTSNSGLARPVAHWPFEDEDGATISAASAVSGVAPADVSGMTFAADSSVVGSAPLATLSASAVVSAVVPTYSDTGTWTVMFVANVPSEPASETGLLGWNTTGTARLWRLTLAPGAPSALHLRVYNSAGTQILDAASSLTEANYYATPIYYTITATQNGTGIDYEYLAYTVTGGAGVTGTLASNTAGIVTSFGVNGPTISGAAFGHLALHVEPGANGLFTSTPVLGGSAGDWPWQRFGRVCEEQGIPYTLQDSDNLDLEMGPQPIASVMQILRECETVEGCLLTDSGEVSDEGGLLWFPARDDRENIAATLTLDVASGQVAPPFVPILDDQDLVNDVEVSRTGGSSARVEDETSVARDGRYRELVTVNTEDDRFLEDLAGWRANLGSVAGMRFPQVSWDLRRSTTLAEDWMACRLSHRIDILNPPSQYPPDDIATILEGFTEVISSDTWQVSANLSPYVPNHVGVIADTSGDTADYLLRLTGDPDCALRTAIDDNDLSLDFDPNFFRWTTAADDFPLDARLGGEVVTYSAIATTAATFVGAGFVAHDNNASVSPALPALMQAGDLMLIFAAIRNSGTGYPNTPTGYTRLPVWAATDNVQIFAKVHSGTESAPTVTFTGGVANATTSAQMAAFRGMPTTLADLADLVITSATTSNGSAANISYPGVYPKQQEGCVVLVLGWRQQDWTSVATLSGLSEIGDPASGLGDNQGIVWDYVIQTTPAVVAEGSFVVTGGVNGIGRGAAVALAGGYQTATISARAVNGATKSHAAGTLIEVEDPGVLGM